VRLLDDVLRRLINKVGVPLLVIAGNHDSADRLGFGAELLRARGPRRRAALTRWSGCRQP
jgi:DNA repair protein SbcD/Mre11